MYSSLRGTWMNCCFRCFKPLLFCERYNFHFHHTQGHFLDESSLLDRLTQTHPIYLGRASTKNTYVFPKRKDMKGHERFDISDPVVFFFWGGSQFTMESWRKPWDSWPKEKIHRLPDWQSSCANFERAALVDGGWNQRSRKQWFTSDRISPKMWSFPRSARSILLSLPGSLTFQIHPAFDSWLTKHVILLDSRHWMTPGTRTGGATSTST